MHDCPPGLHIECVEPVGTPSCRVQGAAAFQGSCLMRPDSWPGLLQNARPKGMLLHDVQLCSAERDVAAFPGNLPAASLCLCLCL